MTQMEAVGSFLQQLGRRIGLLEMENRARNGQNELTSAEIPHQTLAFLPRYRR